MKLLKLLTLLISATSYAQMSTTPIQNPKGKFVFQLSNKMGVNLINRFSSNNIYECRENPDGSIQLVINNPNGSASIRIKSRSKDLTQIEDFCVSPARPITYPICKSIGNEMFKQKATECNGSAQREGDNITGQISCLNTYQAGDPDRTPYQVNARFSCKIQDR